MSGIDLDFPGKTMLLMGNEAIARGALEAGVGFASSYPGTPSAEILPTIAAVAKKMGIYAQWSVNEMVALEAAAGAALGGVRAIVAMKQNGVHVCTDFLAALSLKGVGSGLVLVTCDDPEGRNTGSGEQDTRPVAQWLEVPMMEPGDMQEAKEMTRYLFDLSEQLDVIVMLRAVSKISHSRGNVTLGELPVKTPSAKFDMKYRGSAPVIMHRQLLEKIEKARERFETSPFNKYVGPEKPELLIITSGASWLHSVEAVKMLNLNHRVAILKLGAVFPLPEKLVKANLQKSSRILFIEEIEPFLERSVMEFSASWEPNEPRPVFYGKRTGHIPAYGELNPDTVINSLAKLMGVSYRSRDPGYSSLLESLPKGAVITRSGGICAGCPHKASYWAMKQALTKDGRNGFGTSDIGCYTAGLGPEGFSVQKTLYCMGGGIGVANGFAQLGRFGFKQPVIAAAGDSTFFHASMPGLINAIYNQADLIMLVLDNSTTAMTGFQPHAGSGTNAMGEPSPAIDIEALCKSLGVPVAVCNPYDLQKTTDTMVDLLKMKGVRVCIMKQECELTRARHEGPSFRVHIDQDACLGDSCVYNNVCQTWACPALLWDNEKKIALLDNLLCVGCGVCADICPQGAIVKEAIS